MLVLVTGGAASGKSEHAEKIVCARAHSKLYLATMQPFGKSARARIARHRKLREGKGFHTVERSLDLKGLQIDRHYDGILLEDLGNLLANEIFSPDGTAQNCVKSILDGVEKLKSYCDTLVIVSNEIFSDGGVIRWKQKIICKNLRSFMKKLHGMQMQFTKAFAEFYCR